MGETQIHVFCSVPFWSPLTGTYLGVVWSIFSSLDKPNPVMDFYSSGCFGETALHVLQSETCLDVDYSISGYLGWGTGLDLM